MRTNCIDCLDRTNVAQYAYGLAALGRQLYALGVTDTEKIDLDAPLADELMGCYERMGDTLAHQYGGSAAHNKVILNANVSSSKILKDCSTVAYLFVCLLLFVFIKSFDVARQWIRFCVESNWGVYILFLDVSVLPSF